MSNYTLNQELPVWLSNLKDWIFENLSNERGEQWLKQFLSVIPADKDIATVYHTVEVFVINQALISATKKEVATLSRLRTMHQRAASGAPLPEWAAWSSESVSAWGWVAFSKPAHAEAIGDYLVELLASVE